MLVDIGDYNEWVLRCWYAFLLTQLYARLRELERILESISRCGIQCPCVCSKLTVETASIAPAIPPARRDTMAGVDESYGQMSTTWPINGDNMVDIHWDSCFEYAPD